MCGHPLREISRRRGRIARRVARVLGQHRSHSRTARSAASPDVLTESRTAWPQPASNRAATADAATALLVIFEPNH